VARSKRPPDEGRLIQLVYYLYVLLSAVARRLPERLSYGAARFFGDVSFRISKKRGQVARNLSRITGKDPESDEVQKLVRESYRSYARYWLETFSLVREDRQFFLDRFQSPTKDNLFGIPKDGKGAIIAVAHLGNWDAAGAWVGANGFSLVTVAEVLKPRRMFDFFVDHRARLGMTIYPAEKGVTGRLIEAVKNGAIVAVLADRDLKGTGPEVTFFGEPANFPRGAAQIAIETGIAPAFAGIYGVTLPDGKRGWHAEISERIELPKTTGEEAIQELTQRIAIEIERAIAKRPEEWHVFQPFWKADRERRA
jgi:phosphatidylinositol dimannoside acyltransferase